MNNQTESYIVLKPIAERFSRVASEITDDEIKDLIKSELRDQIKALRFGQVLGDVIDEWLEQEDVADLIYKTLTDSIKNRLKF
jgi:hypothetical protein